MIQTIKEKINDNKKIIIYTFIFVFAFFCFFTARGIKLNTINDKVFQYDLFYEEWYRLLKDFIDGKGFPEYSWNLYMGGDFFSSMSYYVTGDIFVIFLFPLYLFGIKLEYLLTFEIYLCIFLSSINFYLFLKEAKIKNENICIYLSLIYAFGGFSVLFYGQYMFHRTYCFMPLIFYSIERYFNTDKKLLISFVVFIMLLQSFYLMYPISIFMALYCITRLLINKCNIKEITHRCLTLLIFYFIGVLLSAFIIFPAFMYIISSPRLLSNSNPGVFWSYVTYIEFLLSFISSPYPLFTNISDIFATNFTHDYWFSNFIGIIPLIYAIKYCLKKENRPYLLSVIILLLVVFVKPLSSFMNGFSDPCMRWLFVFSFYMLFLCANAFDENIKLYKIDFIIIICFSVLAMLSCFIVKNIDIFCYKEQIICFIVSTISSIACAIIYFKNKSLSIFISFVIIFVFSIFLINIYVENRQGTKYDRVNYNSLHNFIDNDPELIWRWYIDENDLPGPPMMNYNNNLHSNIMSSKTYNSAYDYSTIVFDNINNIGNITSSGAFREVINPYSLIAIGTKYWLVIDETYLPKEINFELVSSLDDMYVYKNLDYLGFGYTSSTIKNIDELDQLNDLLNTTFVDIDIDVNKYNNLSYSKFNTLVKGNNYLYGTIDLESSNILFLPIPNTKGWKLKVNGKDKNIINVNGGFIGIELDSGHSEINLSFSSPGIKLGVLVSFLTTVSIIVYFIIKNKRVYNNKKSIDNK